MNDQTNTEQTAPECAASRAESANSTGGLDGDFEQMAKALGDMMEMETLIRQLTTLAVEYETKNIAPERFAQRAYELLGNYLRSSAVKTPKVKVTGCPKEQR